jgi:hypothetical protein
LGAPAFEFKEECGTNAAAFGKGHNYLIYPGPDCLDSGILLLLLLSVAGLSNYGDLPANWKQKET